MFLYLVKIYIAAIHVASVTFCVLPLWERYQYIRSRTRNIRSDVNMFKGAVSYENSSANLNSCYI